VITREERLAACTALLRRLDQTVATWIGELKRLDADDSPVSAVKIRRDQLAGALSADHFEEFVRLASTEQSFLLRDIDARRERASAAAAMARRQAREQRTTARTLLAELEEKGISDAALASLLKRVSEGSAPAGEAQSALAAGLARLVTPGLVPRLTDAQRELAKRLAVPDVDSASPPTRGAQTVESPRLHELDKRLAELETAVGLAQAQLFSSRAKAIEELPEAEQNLQIDALVIDIGAALKAGKLREKQLAEAYELRAELEAARGATGAALASAYDGLAKAIAANDSAELSAQIGICKSMLDEHVTKLNSDRRRAAILSGLASLGYEVREEMTTAWAKGGKVVVQKPNLPGYGVEVAADPDATRLQVRAVSFDANRDSRRDADVETLWCGDFGKLQGLLATQGGGIDIERAYAIGAIPLKVVAEPVPVSETHRAPIQRTK
jgi:hypothetical protein